MQKYINACLVNRKIESKWEKKSSLGNCFCLKSFCFVYVGEQGEEGIKVRFHNNFYP